MTRAARDQGRRRLRARIRRTATATTRETAPCVGNVIAGPGYFSTLGIPIRGREPTWADVEEKNGAVVVSKALAERMWPGEDAIGKELRPNGVGRSVVPRRRRHR